MVYSIVNELNVCLLINNLIMHPQLRFVYVNFDPWFAETGLSSVASGPASPTEQALAVQQHSSNIFTWAQMSIPMREKLRQTMARYLLGNLEIFFFYIRWSGPI